jgi:hypothetical protein
MLALTTARLTVSIPLSRKIAFDRWAGIANLKECSLLAGEIGAYVEHLDPAVTAQTRRIIQVVGRPDCAGS